MRANTFSILFILISFISKAQSSEHLFTAVGIITNVSHGDIIGLDRLELNINGGASKMSFWFDAQYEDSVYLNKKVKISYTVNKTLKEVDMYANGSSVYFDRKKPKDISKALKVEGILDIYNYGCAMPGTYFITSKDSSITRFSHYVEEKYQTAYEFKNVVVYYKVKEDNMLGELSFINESDTLTVMHEPFYTKSKFETKLSLVKVTNDSRCPNDVICKWGGNAEVLLKVKQPNKKDTTFTLNTHQKFETEIEIDGYNYKLIGLSPYPKKHIGSILQSSYKAQILIEKR